MFGLLKWHEVTGNPAYFRCVVRMAELMMNTFYNGRPPMVSIGNSEMNLAVIHAFVLLYEKTGEQRYLDFVRSIEGDLPDPEAGDYMRYALSGMEFYQCPKPRWESMHIIMGLAELYRATGEERYLTAARQIFFSILKTDVHNTGGFSTREQAVGNPYEAGPIETCCVIAYNALGNMLLEMTGDMHIVEHLERAHYNAILGSFSPTGAWSTYDTPMDGARVANYQDIVFQSRPGSPLLNCCSVNAPRGLGQLRDWGIMEDDAGGLYIHCYEPGEFTLDSGIRLTISGGYPYNGNICIRVDSAGQVCTVALRIPGWSRNTSLSFRGEEKICTSGEYCCIRGVFTEQESICLNLDYALYLEKGAMACAGKVSLFSGPILYGFDASVNPDCNLDALAGWTEDALLRAQPLPGVGGDARLCLEDGTILRDFYHLGVSGSCCRTWLPMRNA